MSTRIGIDVGGTFTDLIYYDDETGESRISKVPSDPENPALACLNAISEGLTKDQVSASELFIHSTTVGLNALLQRSGAVMGMLCTRGFRDVIEFRRGTRKDQYNLLWSPPKPLVPRYLRIPVSERMRADGTVHKSLDEADIKVAAEIFEREGVNSVAIAFLHSWNNPEHELLAADVLRAAGFAGDISLSHQVSAEYREYERTSTAVVDAFVRPAVSTYLKDLKSRLADDGFDGRMLVNRSGGGALSFEEAIQRPFETIMSGPVAGVEGACELSRRFGLGDLVTADVGGTSFDTCLVTNGRAPLLFEGEVAGHAIQAPWTDVRSIGAGGGSVAWVDAGGLLQVGPVSAGASPGPACYGKGGDRPTVTDAAFVLGMLGDGKLASGISLDHRAADKAVKTVARPLTFTTSKAAQGVMRIATASMANAIREITLEQGVDPRELSLFAFGGAGPLMATLIARELGMPRVIIPPFAGNFSAWGLLSSDLVRTRARTKLMPLMPESLELANDIGNELFSELEGVKSPPTGISPVRELSVDMRYCGQEHSITVLLDISDGRIVTTVEELTARFTTSYEQQFSSALPDPLELVTFRATLRTPIDKRQARNSEMNSDNLSDSAVTHDAWSFVEDCIMPFKLIAREMLGANAEVVGPAIITEETATTYLDAGYKAIMHDSACLMIELCG